MADPVSIPAFVSIPLSPSADIMATETIAVGKGVVVEAAWGEKSSAFVFQALWKVTDPAAISLGKTYSAYADAAQDGRSMLGFAAAQSDVNKTLSMVISGGGNSATGNLIITDYSGDSPNIKYLNGAIFKTTELPVYAVAQPSTVTVSDYRPLLSGIKQSNLVAWTKYNDTAAGGVDVMGTLVPIDVGTSSSLVAFRLSNTAEGVQDQPDVAVLGNSNRSFATVFSGYSAKYGNTGSRDVFLTVYNPVADTLTADFRVNTTTSGDQLYPAVAAMGDDKIVIVWQKAVTSTATTDTTNPLASNDDDVDQDIYARVLSTNGTSPITGELRISVDGAIKSIKPEVIGVDSSLMGVGFDTFAVVWTQEALSADGDVQASSVRAQLYDVDGTLVDGFELPLVDQGIASAPSVDLLSDGRIAVTWIDDNSNSGDAMTEIFQTATVGRVIKGTSGSDYLVGTNYNDTIYGYGSADVLYGGKGNDVLHGGGGADTIRGDLGYNTASYKDSPAAVHVNLSAVVEPDSHGGDAEGDILYDIFNLTGSKYGDTLIGDNFNNVLKGGDGNDYLSGGNGNDTLQPGRGVNTVAGGAGTDVVSFIDSKVGLTVDLNNKTLNTGWAASNVLTMSSIEGVGGTNAADKLSGNDGVNVLYGYDGVDQLNGRGGSDKLTGGPGADTLSGGTGADQFIYKELVAKSADKITDFSHTDGDTIELQSASFGGLAKGKDWVTAGGALVQNASPSPTSTKPTVLYDTDSGIVYVDLDGSGSAAKVKLLTFTEVPAKVYATDFHVF